MKEVFPQPSECDADKLILSAAIVHHNNITPSQQWRITIGGRNRDGGSGRVTIWKFLYWHHHHNGFKPDI
jgi:hypothetical protein